MFRLPLLLPWQRRILRAIGRLSQWIAPADSQRKTRNAKFSTNARRGLIGATPQSRKTSMSMNSP
jgi:hypothetical protein